MKKKMILVMKLIFSFTFIYIEDNEYMKENVNLILTTNIWKFFNKINYNFKDTEYKIFKSSEGKIGYIVRNNNVEKIYEIYKSNSKEKRQEKVELN